MSEDYNDSPSLNERRTKRGSSKVGLISAILVLFCLCGFVLYLLFVPPKEKSVPTTIQTPIKVEVKEVEKVVEVEKEKPLTVIEVTQSEKTVVNRQSDDKTLSFIEHTIKEGESLETISEAYAVTIETLINVNRIKNIQAIKEGAVLKIPSLNGRYYTVQQGDMLSSIVRRFELDISWKELMDINGLKSENIKVGQQLFIPDPKPEEVVFNQSPLFSSPIIGKLTALYNQNKDGKTLKGVYFTAPSGSAVTASHDGFVIDRGNNDELGKFIIISHDEGYKTTYAYLERVEVSIGAEVSKGTILGSIGQTSLIPQTLYFMIEQSGISLDPSLFL